MIFDKAYATGKSAVRLAVAAGAVAVAGGFLLLAPQWSINHITDWAGGFAHGVKVGGSWIADLVHNNAN